MSSLEKGCACRQAAGLREQLQRGRRLSLHKEPQEEVKGQPIQFAPREVSSQCKKEMFYGENNHSLEQPPQGHRRVHITGGFQDATGQGDG